MARLLAAAVLLLRGAALAAAGCCSWDKCGSCGDPDNAWCAVESQCVADCGGQYCEGGAQGPGYNTPNVCSSSSSAGAVAYACLDWSIGSLAMETAARDAGLSETHFFGVGSYGAGNANLGKCYEVELAGITKKGVFQVLNEGSDVATGQFDIQMGAGGFGLFNGCAAPTTAGAAPLFSGDKAAFGANSGGWSNRADCAKLPLQPAALDVLPAGELSLPELCEASFEMGLREEGGDNAKIVEVSCRMAK